MINSGSLYFLAISEQVDFDHCWDSEIFGKTYNMFWTTLIVLNYQILLTFSVPHLIKCVYSQRKWVSQSKCQHWCYGSMWLVAPLQWSNQPHRVQEFVSIEPSVWEICQMADRVFQVPAGWLICVTLGLDGQTDCCWGGGWVRRWLETRQPSRTNSSQWKH